MNRRGFLGACLGAVAAVVAAPLAKVAAVLPAAIKPARWHKVVTFNTTTLKKAEWCDLDLAVMRAASVRLRSWADLQQLQGPYADPQYRPNNEELP